jgi:hypothetical protein
LRRGALAADRHATHLSGRDVSGRVYELILRDVGPDKVVTALERPLTLAEE